MLAHILSSNISKVRPSACQSVFIEELPSATENETDESVKIEASQLKFGKSRQYAKTATNEGEPQTFQKYR